MPLKQWFEVLEVILPPPRITEETRRYTIENAQRFRGGMRISTGRFWTDREYEEYRARVLNTPLP